MTKQRINAMHSHESFSLAKEIEEIQETDPDMKKEASFNLSDHHNIRKTNSRLNMTSFAESNPFRFIPLSIDGRTHVVSKGSEDLINEVPLKELKRMTEIFYKYAFQDDTLDKFLRSHDDPHGARFAKWIHQKLSGSNKWDHDRKNRDSKSVTVAGGRRVIVHDRSSAHVAAWYSPKRPKKDVGRHFQLDECRVWMRLHFWAMRDSGLIQLSPSFADYYVRFIGHFVRVYESKAPMFARDSLRWSENSENIEKYIANGRKMKNVLGLSFRGAVAQIPDAEANDMIWPYNQTAEHIPATMKIGEPSFDNSKQLG